MMNNRYISIADVLKLKNTKSILGLKKFECLSFYPSTSSVLHQGQHYFFLGNNFHLKYTNEMHVPGIKRKELRECIRLLYISNYITYVLTAEYDDDSNMYYIHNMSNIKVNRKSKYKGTNNTFQHYIPRVYLAQWGEKLEIFIPVANINNVLSSFKTPIGNIKYLQSKTFDKKGMCYKVTKGPTLFGGRTDHLRIKALGTIYESVAESLIDTSLDKRHEYGLVHIKNLLSDYNNITMESKEEIAVWIYITYYRTKTFINGLEREQNYHNFKTMNMTNVFRQIQRTSGLLPNINPVSIKNRVMAIATEDDIQKLYIWWRIYKSLSGEDYMIDTLSQLKWVLHKSPTPVFWLGSEFIYKLSNVFLVALSPYRLLVIYLNEKDEDFLLTACDTNEGYINTYNSVVEEQSTEWFIIPSASCKEL